MILDNEEFKKKKASQFVGKEDRMGIADFAKTTYDSGAQAAETILTAQFEKEREGFAKWLHKNMFYNAVTNIWHDLRTNNPSTIREFNQLYALYQKETSDKEKQNG